MQTLESVNLENLKISELCQNECVFSIPTYQRGYRWDEKNVYELLEDIWEYHVNKRDENYGEYYCLQPIVVMQSNDNCWEVVDGQQRLTTIFIILKYLENPRIKTKLFSILFERDTMAGNKMREEYLLHIADNMNLDAIKLDQLDFHYFNSTAKTVHEWIAESPEKFSGLQDAILSDVQIIWYELEKGTRAKEVFRHINDGKIDLTNSELIKALLLNSKHFKSGADKHIENELIRMEQERIALLWDEIEIKLHDDNFWHFIYQGEREYQTRIEYIFELIYAEGEGVALNKIGRYDTFSYFERIIKDTSQSSKTSVTQIWDKVKQYYRTFEDWFYDVELYNKIGYIVHFSDSSSVNTLVQKSFELEKALFREYLNQLITKSINLSSLESLSYEKNARIVNRVLILFNLETLINATEPTRFPFSKVLYTHGGKKVQWSLEHIHAQKSKVLKGEALQIWLVSHKASLERRFPFELDSQKQEEYRSLIEKFNIYLATPTLVTDDVFEELVTDLQYIADNVADNMDENDMHSIKNLTLLQMGQNSAVNNSVFDVKRSMIIDMSQSGDYIPPCTLHVFLKFYNKNATRFDFWGKEDGDAYMTAMNDLLSKYLLKVEEA